MPTEMAFKSGNGSATFSQGTFISYMAQNIAVISIYVLLVPLIMVCTGLFLLRSAHHVSYEVVDVAFGLLLTVFKAD